jgi:hypothetical protein
MNGTNYSWVQWCKIHGTEELIEMLDSGTLTSDGRLTLGCGSPVAAHSAVFKITVSGMSKEVRWCTVDRL